MNITNKTIFLVPALAGMIGLSAVTGTLHAFSAIGAAQVKSSEPSNRNAAAVSDDNALVDLTAALQAYQPQLSQADSTDPRPEFGEIKSLTIDEIKAYQEGTGYGMAKAAERNHYPGPWHVLDLAEQLQLTPEQVQQIRKIQDVMRLTAVNAGKQLIADEERLNVVFAESKVDQIEMASLVGDIASLQGRLRLIHLNAHLQTQKILSAAQIAKYYELRGYTKAAKDGDAR